MTAKGGAEEMRDETKKGAWPNNRKELRNLGGRQGVQPKEKGKEKNPEAERGLEGASVEKKERKETKKKQRGKQRRTKKQRGEASASVAAEFLGEKQRGGCIREKEKKKKAEVQSLEKTELRQRGVSAQWGVQKQNEGKTRKSGNWEEGFV